MEKLFQAVYGGILYGSIYGLMAIGLTLIWGSLRMLNMAMGTLYVVGGILPGRHTNSGICPRSWPSPSVCWPLQSSGW